MVAASQYILPCTGYTATTVSATAHLNGVVDVTTMTCTSCHGDTLRTGTDPNIAAMPPVGTAGETLTTQPAVGAHLAHLTAGTLARAFACTDCHNPPLSTNHATGTTTFSWSVLAGGGAVTYNFTNQTCSSTYCHGNFAGGNAANAPSWIAGAATVACGSCHGTPGVTGAPPLPHSQNSACGSCHIGYTATTVNTTNHVNGIVDVVAQTCTTCHGTAGVNSAPPVNTTGGSATTLVSVGAHQAHVASTLRPAIACTECHGAASATYTTAHSDGIVQTSFGTLSNQGTATVWTRASGTCASNYCHGGTTAVAGGTGTTPVWTTVNGTFKACASCHGNPPALNATTHHPANPSCATCHGAGYTSTTVAAATHVNGTVNLSRTGCTLCHGDLTQTGVAATSAASAPGFNATSADSTGATAATVAGVGAHAAHLVGTRWRGTALACNECHTVPAAADVAHATGTGTGGARATVIFGTLARTGGITTATYAGSTTAANGTAAGTCSNTYCHGNFAGSGATGAISWTGGVAAANCGSCHGIPPLFQSDGVTAHSTSTACGTCHGTLYTTTTVDKTIHMNGRIDSGGSHPAGWKEPNQHGLAAMSPAQGGIGFSACTACHTGFGPVTGGGAVSDCNGCHAQPAAVGGPFTTGTYPNHLNWQTECTFCHGGRGGDVAGAPPRNTHVISTDLTTAQPTTDPTIGAHASHTQATHAISGDIACTACHQAVTNITTPGHVDNGLAEVTFAAVGTTANPGTYTRPSCAANYCHGNFTGGASASLSWTGTFGATFTLTCTSCHGSPPGPISATVKHPQSAVCGDCHAGFTSTSVTAAASANHVDGTVNRPTGCTACHGELSSALAAQPVASGSSFAAPGFGATATSKDSKGNAATTARGVGLHNVHLTGGRSKAVACGECHTVPPLNDVAHVNGGNGLVVFSATLANKSGGATYASTTTLTCSSTYCHGNFTGGTGAAATPAWTLAGTLGCTSCHANPPPASAGHPQNTACDTCHGTGYSLTTVNAATHVDGIVNLVAAESCTSCHGQTRTGVSGSDPNVAASPPSDSKGNGVATAVGVGAHLPHVNQSRTTPLSSPFACGVCHPPVAANRHADGTSQVTFVGLAVTGGVTASYTSPSCSATYCHGNFPGGTGSAAPAWNVNGAQLACTSCHGSPPVPAAATASVPASYHPNNPTCTSCHPAGYTATTVTGTAIPTHVNGLVTLNANRTGCVQCHGTPGLVANDAVHADPNVASAPPSDSKGNAVATSAGVGAHVAHVNHATAGRLSLPIHCTECHGVDKTDRTHADGNSAPIFGTIAKTGNVSPTYTSPNCSSTYCHGNFTGGTGIGAAPPWTTAGQLTCNACHGVGATAAATPPGPTSATLHHPQNANCVACHPGYSTTTVNATTHVDGVVNKPTGCTACHGDLTATGVANTDVRAAPAANANATDTRGSASTATNVRGIGAHAKHLTGTAWRSTPMACSECHTVPAGGDETHVTGVVQVAFGTGATDIARTAWPGKPAITPVWNGAGGAATLTCSNTYCHGNFPGGLNPTPTWATPSVVACGACHAIPPLLQSDGVTAHSTSTACGSCHGTLYTTTTVDPTLHMNGRIDGGGESAGLSNCGGCHADFFSKMTAVTGLPVSRHGLGSDLPTDDATNWATPATLSAVAQTNRSCVNMCHADHPHDLTGPVPTTTHENNAYLDATTQATRASGSATRIGSGAGQNRAKTDFDSILNTGLCASCHQKALVVNGITVSAATFGASAHDFTSNTVGANVYTWTFPIHDGSTFARNCTKCHASRVEGITPASTTTLAVHYNTTDPNLLSGTTNPAGSAANFICYNCHGTTATPAAGAQGNRSGKDIQSQIAHVGTGSGHPANSDAVHNSATEFANAAFGTQLGLTAGSVARHAACLDCHDPHEAKAGGRTYTTGTATVSGTAVTGIGTQWSSYYVGAGFRLNSWAAGTWATISAVGGLASITLAAAGPSSGTNVAYTITSITNLASPALAGTWGAQLSTNPAFFAAPATGNMAKKAIVPGTDLEATLCLKCHSGFYGTLPTAPSSVGLPAPLAAGYAETDQAKEFNPANAGTWSPTWSNTKTAGSFHPVLANAGGNLGAINLTNLVTTNFPWKNSGATRNVMSCSDCHESDTATDPNGPHGSAAKFILRGPNTRWDRTVALNSTSPYMPTDTFCANCHSTTYANTRTIAHTNGRHTGTARGTCFMCHVAIPHGSMRPGLLTAQHGGPLGTGANGLLATDQAPYNQSPVTSGLGIGAYPANQTTGWGNGSSAGNADTCGCGSVSTTH